MYATAATLRYEFVSRCARGAYKTAMMREDAVYSADGLLLRSGTFVSLLGCAWQNADGTLNLEVRMPNGFSRVVNEAELDRFCL